MKPFAYISFIVISLFAMVFHNVNIFSQINQHVATMHPLNGEISEFFFSLFIKQIMMMVFVTAIVTVMVILLINSNRRVKEAMKFKNINKELMKKQNDLEEQSAIIEELNSQLEDENNRYVLQKEILKAIIESLGAGIIMVDLDGKVMFINKAWKDLFNYIDFGKDYGTQDDFYVDCETCWNTELLLKNTMFGMENGQEILKKLIELLKDNESRYAVDIEQTNPVKRFINLYSNPCISSADHSFGRVFVVRDISHQKEVDRLKMELISTVSHELRTPMSSIMGFSELLLTRKLSEERNKEYIGIINSESKRLTNLINDFLDIQRMESGKQVFNKQYNSIDEIITEALRLFQDVSDKHRIVYKNYTKKEPFVYCDRDKMLQVLSNLLSNAIKYSPKGGNVTIILDGNKDNVNIKIIDEGLGIPEDMKAKLFTKFFRIDNDDRREIGGTGLGLAICKEIIKAHGGKIGVESAFGKGSTFFIDLPSCARKKVEADHLICSESEVLIVEDDEAMVRLIRDILKEEGLGVSAAGSGEEALELLEKYDYKLIILDIALSGKLTGWDVFKKLKDNQRTSNIPIIISSVYDDKNMASQSGIENYLVKPFDLKQLANMVKKALNGNLSSKMMVNNSDGKLEEIIVNMLSNKGIFVKQIEHSGNMLVITLDREEGYQYEQ